ncbi:MAG: hypothetical protein IJ715_03145 [Bacilli bacterium]|nr:hypothetical protein [Bacilli bacterium]
MDKNNFIVLYMDEYVRMAYRKIINKVDTKTELKLIHILHDLLDEYSEGELTDYIHYNKII